MLSRWWTGTLPVDPMQIATCEGLRAIAANPFDETHEKWMSGASGRFDAGHRLIMYSGIEPPVRQRFTVAHELGHYALEHGNAFRDDPSSFSSRAIDWREREANQFAAELLMPTEALLRIVRSGTVADAGALAAMFNVSKVAMSYRLQNLGLLS